MSLKLGDIVQIHSFKHDKTVHRIWNKVKVLYHDSKMLVAANNRTRVIEANGRTWNTREPAICFFYKESWFNIIAMMKRDGIYYYCNLSSPYVYDGEAIKYIDYDLDLKVFPDNTYQILDENEFKSHKEKMGYDDKIEIIIRGSIKELIEMVEKKEAPFNKAYIMEYYDIYRKEGI